MNNLLSNYPGSDMPIVGIVIALFSLITVYYAILITAFDRSWTKLIVSYTFIVILLTLVLLISQYYFVFFNNYTENFIADYRSNTTAINKQTNEDTKHMNHTAFTTNPFAVDFNVDEMCNKFSPGISWKCSVRDAYKQDTFSLKTTEDDVNSSIKYPLKYDGIYTLDDK
jgi:hypothetical protein